MKMTSKTYDAMKWVSWVWAPLITLVTALVNIWAFDCKHFEQIIATLTAVDVFIGAITGWSNYEYHKEKETGNELDD